MSDPLRSDLAALADAHGLEAVLEAALALSRREGRPYGATTPRDAAGTLRGHGPCLHCGATEPTGEVWETDDDGVLCLVRCGACGQDYAEYYTPDDLPDAHAEPSSEA